MPIILATAAAWVATVEQTHHRREAVVDAAAVPSSPQFYLWGKSLAE